ncbi:hypothetical protein NQ318_005349 [Aromia moschata]|uniref:Uncharacterized protein n=1 Tax=Aromia moschata TaxID=1265417 RepID=A0AAV8YWA0_9CUCU|nr:hypothetical protein NQ318_005349 [Aromia moschata]
MSSPSPDPQKVDHAYPSSEASDHGLLGHVHACTCSEKPSADTPPKTDPSHQPLCLPKPAHHHVIGLGHALSASGHALSAGGHAPTASGHVHALGQPVHAHEGENVADVDQAGPQGRKLEPDDRIEVSPLPPALPPRPPPGRGTTAEAASAPGVDPGFGFPRMLSTALTTNVLDSLPKSGFRYPESQLRQEAAIVCANLARMHGYPVMQVVQYHIPPTIPPYPHHVPHTTNPSSGGIRKYVFWCCACGGLATILGALFLAVYFLLRSYTSTLGYFETIPTFVPATMVYSLNIKKLILKIKVCGLCCLVCALTCVLVTITTTVIHMNRLQTLRECVYTQKTRTCTCYSVLLEAHATADDGTTLEISISRLFSA